MEVFYTNNNEKTYPKGRVLMQMYRVVPQTKRGNLISMFKTTVLQKMNIAQGMKISLV